MAFWKAHVSTAEADRFREIVKVFRRRHGRDPHQSELDTIWINNRLRYASGTQAAVLPRGAGGINTGQ